LSGNFTFEYCSKICPENSSVIKILTRIIDTLHENHYTFMIILLNSSSNEKYFREQLLRKSKHTFYVQSFFFLNGAIYEIMWKRIAELDKSQMTTWHMLIACWIPKARNTLRICNTFCLATAKMVARMCLNITLHIHCLSCSH
jgi:hypothetical protein